MCLYDLSKQQSGQILIIGVNSNLNSSSGQSINKPINNLQRDIKQHLSAMNSSKHHQAPITSGQQQLRQVLDKIMPEIQKQLIHDIQQQLNTQFEQTFLKRVHQMDTQALSQYQQALAELESSKTLLSQEKQKQLQQEITTLQHMLQQMNTQHLLRLQQQYLENNFDNIIMAHPRIQALEKQLQQDIFVLLQPKHETTKSRQIKQLIITHETKQIKLRKELDHQIKSKIYYSSGLQQLKHQIKQSKTQMGSQKSQYNLRLKKIQSEIKQYQQKINDIHKMAHQDKLEDEYQQLKIQLLHCEHQYKGQNINTNSKKTTNTYHNHKYHNNCNDHQQYQHNDEITEHVDNDDNHQDQKLQQHDHENQQYDSSNNPQNYYIADSQGGRSGSYQHNNAHINQGNKNKFDLTAYFNHYLEKNQLNHEGNHQQLTTNNYTVAFTNNVNQSATSLLNLKNISDILKQKVTQLDPLEKYIQSLQKQNNPNNNNNNTKPNESNFTQLYEQHLKNLNKGFAKKAATLNNHKSSKSKQTVSLSQIAKKTIIRNLAQYHKSNFKHNKQQQFQSKRVSTFDEQQPEGHHNDYERNILNGKCI